MLWSLAESMTTVDELRARLPELDGRDVWISDESGDRFGLIAFGEHPADAVAAVTALIGHGPVVVEEFEGG